MEYIENELKKCQNILSNETENDLRYMLIYAVQQALEFSLDPTAVASPIESILTGKVQPIKGIQEDSKDYGCSPSAVVFRYLFP